MQGEIVGIDREMLWSRDYFRKFAAIGVVHKGIAQRAPKMAWQKRPQAQGMLLWTRP
jgi:hypothetical protein